MRALALVLLSDAGRTFQLERSFTSHSISATTRAVTELNFSECQKWSRPGPANWCHASGRLLKFSEDVSDDMLLPRRATVTQTSGCQRSIMECHWGADRIEALDKL